MTPVLVRLGDLFPSFVSSVAFFFVLLLSLLVVMYDSVDKNATPQFLGYKNYSYIYFLMIIVYICCM